MLLFKQLENRYGDMDANVVSTLANMDHAKINYDLIVSLVLWILKEKHSYPREGSILIFLPGIGEISSLFDKLEQKISFHQLKCLILPLHSSLNSEEQR